jgi:hypothetical protein
MYAGLIHQGLQECPQEYLFRNEAGIPLNLALILEPNGGGNEANAQAATGDDYVCARLSGFCA